MKRFHILALCIAVWAAGVTGAHAQLVSATTGAITGKVVDSNGAPLPGVTVSITSPALMGTQVSKTNNIGMFRFPGIPPGPYRVEYEQAGYSKVVRQGVLVGLSFTATVDAQMTQAQIDQTASGSSPMLDVQSTRTATNFDKQQMADMPSARDMWSGVLAQSAAVQVARIDVGGSAAGTQTGYSAYDFKGGQNRPMLEGLVVTEGTSGAGFYYDYGSFAEVSAGTAAHPAEMGWPGVQTMFISKSGGNAYHGNVYFDYQNEKIQRHNIDEQQIALGFQGGGGLAAEDINRMAHWRDFRADAGGFLAKDKLWFYGGFRDQSMGARYPNFPVKPHDTYLKAVVGKGTYALSPTNRLIGYMHAGLKQQPNRLDRYLLNARVAIHENADSTWNQRYWGHGYKGEWNSVLSDRAYLEVRGGQFGYDWPNYSYTKEPSYEDLGNNKVYGSNREWASNIRRNQGLGSVTLFAGRHSVKIGGEVFRETGTRIRPEDYLPGGVLHVLNNGNPIEVYLFQAPSMSENALWTYSGYVADVWRVSDKLTVSPGVRFDRYDSFLPEQEHAATRFNPVAQSFPETDVLTWNLLAPRLGATYDLNGNGKTILKFNYGRYWNNPGVVIAEQVNPNPPDWYSRYQWKDTNGNRVWDPGEEGRLIAAAGAGSTQILDPDLKNTYTQEIAAWFERELMANFSIRTGIVWRGIRQKYESFNATQPYEAFNVPVVIPDPGPDGVAGNGDDGAAISGFNLDPSLVGLAPRNVTANRAAKDDYYTWEFTATKRMSNRFSLNGMFSYRVNKDNGKTYYDNTVRDTENPRTPNDFINTTGGRNVFATWTGKINGTFDSPWWGLRFSPTLAHQSGQPWGRSFLARLNYGNVRILAEPLDTRRQDNIWLLNLRIEKGLRYGGRRVGLFFDLYNATNLNANQNIVYGSGPSFMRPTQIVPPTIARVGVKLDW